MVRTTNVIALRNWFHNSESHTYTGTAYAPGFAIHGEGFTFPDSGLTTPRAGFKLVQWEGTVFKLDDRFRRGE